MTKKLIAFCGPPRTGKTTLYRHLQRLVNPFSNNYAYVTEPIMSQHIIRFDDIHKPHQWLVEGMTKRHYSVVDKDRVMPNYNNGTYRTAMIAADGAIKKVLGNLCFITSLLERNKDNSCTVVSSIAFQYEYDAVIASGWQIMTIELSRPGYDYHPIINSQRDTREKLTPTPNMPHLYIHNDGTETELLDRFNRNIPIIELFVKGFDNGAAQGND